MARETSLHLESQRRNPTYRIGFCFRPTGEMSTALFSFDSPWLSHWGRSFKNPWLGLACCIVFLLVACGPGNASSNSALSGFSCSNPAAPGSGSVVCKVTLASVSSRGPVQVVLKSYDTAVEVPSTVTVPENSISAEFAAKFSTVPSAQSVMLTAKYDSTMVVHLPLIADTIKMTIDKSEIAFDDVRLENLTTQSLTLTSTGTEPLTISAAKLTGAGFSVSGGSLPVTLKPNEKATLTVEFRPTVTGSASGQIAISSNSSGSSTTVINLSGTGIEPGLSSFDCTSITPARGAGTDLCTVTLASAAITGAAEVSLRSDNPAFSVPTFVTVPANATSAQFLAQVASVTSAQSVMLTANFYNTLVLHVDLSAATRMLTANTTNLTFPAMAVNTDAVQLLTLTSNGTEPVLISGATLSGKGYSISGMSFPLTLSPMQTATLRVQFNPTTAGSAPGELVLTTNATNGETSIALGGTATSPNSFTYAGSPLVASFIPPNPSAAISSDFFGLTILHTATPFPSFPVSTLRFWGVDSWSTVEPSSGELDWTGMDTMIQQGKAKGVSDFIYTFGDVPAWASTSPTEACTGGYGVGTCAPPDMTAFDNFAKQLVQRYCGTIRYYETWNEPNDEQYWSGTNAQLLTIAQHLYQIAKDPANCASSDGTNPNKVLMPPISRINSANLNWLDSFLSSAGADYPYADVASFHGYGSSTDPEAIATQVPQLTAVLAKHGLSKLPLWTTEADWGSTTVVSQDQASWLMRYHVALATTGVSRFLWYAYDNCSWGTLYEGYCPSPQMPVATVTEGGTAYAVVENWLSGADLSGCQEYENGLWACKLQRADSYVAWILWSSTGAEISVPIPTGSGLTLYRNWQNTVNTIPTELTVGEMPVLLSNTDL